MCSYASAIQWGELKVIFKHGCALGCRADDSGVSACTDCGVFGTSVGFSFLLKKICLEAKSNVSRPRDGGIRTITLRFLSL